MEKIRRTLLSKMQKGKTGLSKRVQPYCVGYATIRSLVLKLHQRKPSSNDEHIVARYAALHQCDIQAESG